MSIGSYIDQLSLPNTPAQQLRRTPEAITPEVEIPADLSAAINAGSVLSFVEGVSHDEAEDVLFSTHLASWGASGKFDKFTEPRAWYQKYVEILENIGWVGEQFAFVNANQSEGEVKMDQAALAIITAIATQNQLAVLKETIGALEKLADGDGKITLFDFHSSSEDAGNFQIGSVQKASNGSLSMALGAFHFRAVDKRKKFLFFKWGQSEINLWTGAQKMTLNRTLYGMVREKVKAKLAGIAAKNIDFL